jgi:hypothetical protein
VVPLVQLVAAELVSRGVPSDLIERNVHFFGLYSTAVKIRAQTDNQTYLLSLITQSGSIRNNLTNRCRDIVGDAVNLRFAAPEARHGLIYVIRSDEEAMRLNPAGQSAVDDLAKFMREIQRPFALLGRPLIDACALVAANQESGAQIRVLDLGRDLNIRDGFFERLLVPPTLAT